MGGGGGTVGCASVDGTEDTTSILSVSATAKKREKEKEKGCVYNIHFATQTRHLGWTKCPVHGGVLNSEMSL